MKDEKQRWGSSKSRSYVLAAACFLMGMAFLVACNVIAKIIAG
jgi:hypothetical protein